MVRDPGTAVPTARTRCACEAWNTVEIDEDLPGILCGACEAKIALHIPKKLLEGGRLERCVRCDARETSDFWIRKDFDPKLGVGIVVVAAVLAFWTYGLSLLVATFVDLFLYWRLPLVTTCYRCKTEVRAAPLHPDHGGFDLAHQEDIEQEQAEAERARRGLPEPGDEPVL